MSSFGSDDEDCDSDPGSWAYQEDVPLDLSGNTGLLTLNNHNSILCVKQVLMSS